VSTCSRQQLYTAAPSWVWIDVVSDEDARWLPAVLYGKAGIKPVIRVLRGQRMRRLQSLMDEFSAVLQFFEGFGGNWYALKECLSDMDEWLPGDAYLLVVTKPEQVLEDEPKQRVWLRRTLEEVGDWWSRPVVGQGRFDRPSIPFHTVLQCREVDYPTVQACFPGVPRIV
jgi:hypothetical protein